MRIAITGANGHLGQRLLQALLAQGGDAQAESSLRPASPLCLVRREAAATSLRQAHPQANVRVVDYLDAAGMATALQGIDRVVHLVGILLQNRRSTYRQAHEETTGVLVQAAAESGVQGIVALSIVGAGMDSGNACLASRGRADALLLSAPVPAEVIRLPMVLGEGDYATQDLTRRARRAINLAFRAASLDQPIYAGDVIRAIGEALKRPPAGSATDLAGPESLSRRHLNQRAAAILGRRTRTISLPIGLGYALAWLMEKLPDPPLSRAMLGVLDQDDRLDMSAHEHWLTPLDAALARVLGSK